MFRLLGFLIGSVTALMIILMVLGVPDFHLSDSETDQARFDAAVKKLREKQRVVAEAAEKDGGELATSPDTAIEESTSVTEETLPELPVAATAEPAQVPGRVAPLHEVESKTGLPTAPGESQWYSFWNPFRSEIAARGFVSRLEKVTGLDYRVVKVRTGVYEVAFAYGNDEERRTKLSQISAATGLELPDS